MLVRVPVTLEEAVNGTILEVPTLDGKSVRLRLPAGSPTGRKLRAKGRGFVTKKGTGDMLVIPEVQIPTDLTDEAQAALSRFLELAPQGNPREELFKKAGV